MNQPTTLRDTIEAAIETTEEPAAQTPAPAPEPVAAAEPAAESAESAAESAPAAAEGQDLNALAEGEKPADNNELQQQQRDEQGRFKGKQEGIQPGPKSGPRQQGDKAPASWRPDVREHWGQLPEPVRAEIQRRELEVQRTLQDTAEARKTAEAVMKTIAPYEAFIRAENSNPLQAIDNLMSTAARLRTGTAPELAQLMTGLIQQFGVGRFGSGFVEMLDSALAGQQPKGDPQQLAIEQVLNQRLAPIQNMFQQFQQVQVQQQQRVAQQAQGEVEQFLGRAEFGEDVREEMADLLESAQRRGQNMTLAEAYQKACMLNDRVRSVLTQRVKAKGAQQTTQAAQRARSAAVQVSGGAPMGGMKQEPTDVRAAIEAAISASTR